MKRKVVRQGAATLMVSLPSKWTKAVNLRKGDEVDIEESNGNLVISKEAREIKKQATINITHYTESSIRVALWNAYRTGYSRIVVNFADDKQYAIVKDVIKNYIVGFDVTKKEKNSCVIENITEPTEEQFEVIFRKILYNVALLIDITEDRLRNKPGVEDYNEVVLKIHQYDNFCRRVIAKKNLGTEAYLLWSFLTLLVHGQRELYHLNRFLDKNKFKFTNFELFNGLRKIFDLLSEGYIKKDLSKFEKVHDMQKQMIYDEFYSIIQKSKGKENVILYHIAASIRKFYLSASPLVGLLLESNIST